MTTTLRFCLCIAALVFCGHLWAQDQYFTRTAHLHLKTSNRFGDIEADNYQVFAQLDLISGEIKFSCLIKSFEFQLGAANRVMDSKALNVSEFPKATYQGRIINLDQVNFSKPGNYTVKIEGDLFVWDEKRRTKSDVIITVRPDQTIFAKSNFIMIIEEKNMEKANRIISEKLPDIIDVDTHMLGISRNIFVDLDMVLKGRH